MICRNTVVDNRQQVSYEFVNRGDVVCHIDDTFHSHHKKIFSVSYDNLISFAQILIDATLLVEKEQGRGRRTLYLADLVFRHQRSWEQCCYCSTLQ